MIKDIFEDIKPAPQVDINYRQKSKVIVLNFNEPINAEIKNYIGHSCTKNGLDYYINLVTSLHIVLAPGWNAEKLCSNIQSYLIEKGYMVNNCFDKHN